MVLVIFKQMVIFFIMILLGIVARKKNIITQQNQQQFSALVINLALPCMILSSAMTATDKIGLKDALEILAVFAILLVIVLGIAAVIPKILGYPPEQRGAVNLMFWCTNIAYIGLPLIKGMYGNQAVIYVTIYIMATNFLFYSYAVTCIRSGMGEKKKFNPKSLLNAGMISCVLACLIYFMDIPVPDVLSQAFGMIGNITSPMAMMMIGFGLLDVDFKEMVRDVRMMTFIVLKMLAFPVLIMMIMKQITDNEYLLATCMAIVAIPTGGMVSMLATLHNPGAYLLVTKQISMATLLSVATVPLVAAIVGI
ncbi:MAG: AEC family transporter [Firmicutes bacterium]|nr:AEC family transporter [Bacillota bacterium]